MAFPSWPCGISSDTAFARDLKACLPGAAMTKPLTPRRVSLNVVRLVSSYHDPKPELCQRTSPYRGQSNHRIQHKLSIRRHVCVASRTTSWAPRRLTMCWTTRASASSSASLPRGARPLSRVSDFCSELPMPLSHQELSYVQSPLQLDVCCIHVILQRLQRIANSGRFPGGSWQKQQEAKRLR